MDAQQNPTAKSSTPASEELRAPRLPAAILPLGFQRSLRQARGGVKTFRVVRQVIVFQAVYSPREENYSDWFSYQRVWLPVDELLPGQIEVRSYC